MALPRNARTACASGLVCQIGPDGNLLPHPVKLTELDEQGIAERYDVVIDFTQFNVGQLKILQEVITLSVFLPFSVFFMRQPLRLDYLWAALCMMGAVYFIFRGGNFSR